MGFLASGKEKLFRHNVTFFIWFSSIDGWLLQTERVKNKTSNFCFQAICEAQPLPRVNELLATTANSVLCLCVVLAGSETEVAAIVPLQFCFLYDFHAASVLKPVE